MKTKPSRVTTRPDPEQWGEHELMSLAEAAALMWPQGPLTETSLRTAVRQGRLPISKVAGKFLTTRAALAMLAVCERLPAEPVSQGSSAPATGGRYLEDLLKVDAMSGRMKSNRMHSE